MMHLRPVQPPAWIDALETETDLLSEFLIATRRHLHQNPELSMEEYRSTEYISKILSEQGLVASPTSRSVGLVCDLDSIPADRASCRIGIRGDMDALPIQTCLQTEYASHRPGVMHACGHDAHTTMALGATLLLSRLAKNNSLPWPVHTRTIFQPAEEASYGGAYMIREGALVGLTAVLALHVEPSLRIGHVATRSGAFTAGCMQFRIRVHGRSGHSARPHQAADALAAASQFMQQAYVFVPRSYDCRDSAVLHFGSFHSGVAANVVSDLAELTGTLRTLSNTTRDLVHERLLQLAQGVELSTGCQFEFEVVEDTPSLLNDRGLALDLLEFAEGLPRVHVVTELEMPSMGAEDFSFMAAQVPACMFRLGTASSDGESFNFPLHSEQFDIDEGALAVGSQFLAAAAIHACRPQDA